MSGFEPGEGWREVDPSPSRDERLCLVADGVISRQWVHESTVPPLPTEPYTVIRTGPMRWMKCGLYVHPDGSKGNPNAWVLLPYDSQTERRAILTAHLAVTCIYDEPHVRQQAAEFGFEVLSEPRAVTPDAVADLVEAVRLTVEFVGLETLPPIEGWSWYDALRKHAPELAEHFVREAKRLGVTS